MLIEQHPLQETRSIKQQRDDVELVGENEEAVSGPGLALQ